MLALLNGIGQVLLDLAFCAVCIVWPGLLLWERWFK